MSLNSYEFTLTNEWRKKVEDEREDRIRRKNCANNSLVYKCNCKMWNNFFLVSGVALLILSSLFALSNVVYDEYKRVALFYFIILSKAPGVDAFLNFFFHRSFHKHAMKVDLFFQIFHGTCSFFSYKFNTFYDFAKKKVLSKITLVAYIMAYAF